MMMMAEDKILFRIPTYICSQWNYFTISQARGYNLVSRGVISVKGKGNMATWFLV